eukprot:3222826-Pyramimonas_sp.AAC.1
MSVPLRPDQSMVHYQRTLQFHNVPVSVQLACSLHDRAPSHALAQATYPYNGTILEHAREDYIAPLGEIRSPLSQAAGGGRNGAGGQGGWHVSFS